MAVRDYIPLVGRSHDRSAHYECRACGRTLDAGTETCPDCNGDVAVYEL